jgi:nitric oxide reductase NorD protein
MEAAHAAAVQSAALWRRVRPKPAGPPGLAEIQGRLALFLEAMCPDAPPITVAEPSAVPTWLGRIARRLPPHLAVSDALASTDGVRLRLPRVLGVAARRVPEAYRIVALGQVLRARRGSCSTLPKDAPSPVRDLYAIAEAAAVDHELALMAPGLVPALEELRGLECELRPEPNVILPAERVVERLLQGLLAAKAAELPPDLPLMPAPEDSLAWARATALAAIPHGARYRGLAPVPLWGRLDAPEAQARSNATDLAQGADAPPPPGRTRTLARRPRVRAAEKDEDDRGHGLSMVPTSDRQESVEDPMGLTRPTDREDRADPGALADSLSELPEARLVTTSESPREVLASDDPPSTGARAPVRKLEPAGIAYPEWNWKTAAYLPERVRVRLVAPREGTDSWATDVLGRHAALVQHTRRQFERLRPRRVRLTRQVDGPDVDLDAYVEAYADARAGHPATDRVYLAERPLRRDLSLLILVDASASTDAWVDGQRRIIDVEKEALLVLCEGLEALGDRYGILAFSGEGPEAVQMSSIKEFGSPRDASVRRRIAGLEPERYTRLGAALRHATGILADERAPHRILLLLSDGKPNDVDAYEGRYGVEDARQAVHEARALRIQPFCLTVDRHAAAYLPRIFGPAGFTVLRRVRALPDALLQVVRRLVH